MTLYRTATYSDSTIGRVAHTVLHQSLLTKYFATLFCYPTCQLVQLDLHSYVPLYCFKVLVTVKFFGGTRNDKHTSHRPTKHIQ